MYLILLIFFFIISAILFLTKKNPPIIISVEGNVGSGKSKLIKNLKSKYEFYDNIKFLDSSNKTLFDIKDENKKHLFDYFLEDKSKYSYILQNFLFIIKTKTLINMIKDNYYTNYQKPIYIICERSVNSDKNIYTKYLYDEKSISDIEYKIFNYWYDYVFPIVKVTNVIYLKTLPETAYSRKSDKNIPKYYIQLLHSYHEEWLNDKSKELNVCVLDGNKNLDKNTLNTFYKQIDDFMSFL